MSVTTEFEQLLEIMRRLRGPDGCPWDRAQTQMSIRHCLVEEAGEFLDALEDGDDEGMCEELGDLFLQVVFQACLTAEDGRFTLEDVLRNLNQKLVSRHEHVFGQERAADAADARRRWDARKALEAAKQSRKSSMDAVPRHLPALSRAQKAATKAVRAGLGEPEDEQALARFDHACTEFRKSWQDGETQVLGENTGTLLFALVELCRRRQLEAEECLQAANGGFMQRVRRIEAELQSTGRKPDDCTPDERKRLWDMAKDDGIVV